MRQILKNSEADADFKRDGYIVLPQFIDSDKRQYILQCFEKFNLEKTSNIQLTNLVKDVEIKSQIHQLICSELMPQVRGILIDYEPVQGIFSNKPPHPDSAMCIHRDWSLVDESLYMSLSVWCLISGDSEMHGHMDVWPESHLENKTTRGRNFAFEVDIAPLPKSKKTVYTKVGDVIIFDHRLVHSSGVNYSNSDRLATVLALIPKEADLLHYYKDILNQKINILELDKQTFHQLDFSKSDYPPFKKIIQSIPF